MVAKHIFLDVNQGMEIFIFLAISIIQANSGELSGKVGLY